MDELYILVCKIDKRKSKNKQPYKNRIKTVQPLGLMSVMTRKTAAPLKAFYHLKIIQDLHTLAIVTWFIFLSLQRAQEVLHLKTNQKQRILRFYSKQKQETVALSLLWAQSSAFTWKKLLCLPSTWNCSISTFLSLIMWIFSDRLQCVCVCELQKTVYSVVLQCYKFLQSSPFQDCRTDISVTFLNILIFPNFVLSFNSFIYFLPCLLCVPTITLHLGEMLEQWSVFWYFKTENR